MTDEKNYVVIAVGRGVTFCWMVKGELEDVAKRCQNTINSGFEVYVYELTPSPAGTQGFSPENSTALKRVYHLYDAHEEFIDGAKSLVDRLSEHSQAASVDYLHDMLNVFQEALKTHPPLIKPDIVPSKEDLTNDTTEPTTGS